MLSSFLSQLQGYFSKYFIVGAFFPLLSCAVINALIGYVVFPGWQNWIDAKILKAGLSEGTFIVTSLIVAITLMAYVMYGLVTAMRQGLEGRHWGSLGRLIASAQIRALERLRARTHAASEEVADLRDAPLWRKRLDDARDTGRRDHAGVLFRLPDPDETERQLDAQERLMRMFEPVKAVDLERLVGFIEEELFGADFGAGPEGDVLLKRKERLQILIDYASERALATYAYLKNELDANFGAQDVAPTTMGNVANTIQSYALRRYGCNLDLVWSNLLQVAQDKEKVQATLLDAKTLLDFLVTCCWLTLLSSAGWVTVFIAVAPSRWGYLGSALGGPFVAWLWYRAATEQYRAFADIAMTTLDMLRFDLLKALRIRAPSDVEDERIIWSSVTSLTVFDEPVNFTYETPKS
jgi:hypothetical protein